MAGDDDTFDPSKLVDAAEDVAPASVDAPAEDGPPLDVSNTDNIVTSILGPRKTRASRSSKAKSVQGEQATKAYPGMPRDDAGKLRPKGFEPEIQGIYEAIAMGVAFVDADTSFVIKGIAPDAAVAWNKLAKNNPKVRAFLTTLTTTGAYGELMIAHLPLFMLAFNKMSQPKIVVPNDVSGLDETA